MSAAITVQNLGKRYRISHQPVAHAKYKTLRDSLASLASAPFRHFKNTSQKPTQEDFWALSDVSFTVNPGEVVGLIGRNGAGKSTLLKILSRITKPTTGQVQLRGRIGSLLEVGTGFHPELSGRENIYLNGSILGMTRREIDRKFDQIVDFAEVEKFLDTPVKRYSSGMYVRLAFAVAAHLEPEILIVDEVLAVGDLAFQRKCMGRMREVGQNGATVLFVSHNMPAIQTLCTRAILLDHGNVTQQGSVPDIIRTYNRQIISADAQISTPLHAPRPHVTQHLFTAATLLDDASQPTNFIPLSSPFHLRLTLQIKTPIEDPVIGVGIDDTLGQRLLTVYTPLRGRAISHLAGHCEVDCRIPHLPLSPGDYCVKLALSISGCELDCVEKALHFSIIDADAFGEGRGHHRGLCIAPSIWTARSLSETLPAEYAA
jgi:lipopolysaccharide transport system ATP-binding protein